MMQETISTAFDTTDTRYEEDASNVWWRVTAQAESSGGVTNALTVTREQLTGLSRALLSRTVTVSPDGTETTVTRAFEPGGDVIAETSRTGNAAPRVRRTLYGRELESAGPDTATLFAYDGFGRAVSRTVINAAGMVSTAAIVYDTLGNAVTNETAYEGLTAVTATGYDSQGRAVSRTDALGNTVFTQYDSLGQILGQSGATYPVAYAYDTAGRMTALSTTRDGETWDTTLWLYDHATGLLTNKVYADNSRISYTHTQDGKPRRTTWARGAWKENAYDALGQLASVTYSDATPDVSLNRNAFGTVTNVSDATGLTHVYAVNDRQSATNETVTISGDTVFTLDRALDGRNRVENARVTVGAEKLGETVFARDAEGRVSLVAVTNAADVGSRTFYGYESGRSSGWETPLGNGGTLRRVILRDPFRPDLVTGVSNTVDGVTVSAFGYGHGLTGKRAWQEDFDGYATVTNTFLYNASGEVTNAVLGADNHAYAYDPIGNRVWSAVNTLTNTYAANSLNQYTLISNPVNPVNPVQILPTYDADGNMKRLGDWCHAWDAENRLVQSQPYGIATNGAERVVNGYDHRNRRVFKRVEILTGAEPVLPPSPPGNPGEWVEIRSTAFVWDNDRIAAEITSYTNGVVTTNAYFWGADMSGTADGAAGVGGLVRASLNGSDVLYCYDAHGNVTELVDAHSGAVVARYRYGVFGGTVRAEGPLAAANPWRFATRYHDGETGLIMFPRRPYSPGLGRFLSRDPIGTRGGLNEYGFVDNDPVNKWDYLGLFGNPVCGPAGCYYPPDPCWGNCPPPQGISEPCASGFCVVGTTIDTCYGGLLQHLGIDHVDITYNGGVVFVGQGGDVARRIGQQYVDVNHKYPLSKRQNGAFQWGRKTNCPCKGATDDDILNCLRAIRLPSNYNCQGSAQAAVDGCCLSGFKTLVSSCFPTW